MLEFQTSILILLYFSPTRSFQLDQPHLTRRHARRGRCRAARSPGSPPRPSAHRQLGRPGAAQTAAGAGQSPRQRGLAAWADRDSRRTPVPAAARKDAEPRGGRAPPAPEHQRPAGGEARSVSGPTCRRGHPQRRPRRPQPARAARGIAGPGLVRAAAAEARSPGWARRPAPSRARGPARRLRAVQVGLRRTRPGRSGPGGGNGAAAPRTSRSPGPEAASARRWQRRRSGPLSPPPERERAAAAAEPEKAAAAAAATEQWRKATPISGAGRQATGAGAAPDPQPAGPLRNPRPVWALLAARLRGRRRG